MYGAPSIRQLTPLALLVVLGAVLPLVLPAYYLYIGNLLMMYAILALGLDLLLGWAGQFAFAHIAFFGIGVYGTALLQMRLGWPFVLAMPSAAILAGVVGMLIALPSTRLRAVNLALATFAFAEFAQWVAKNWQSVTNGADGLRIPAAVVVPGYVTGTDARAFPVVALILAAVVASLLYLTRSRFGRALCAVRESEHVAAASGVNVAGTKVWAFVCSAVYAGIAGGTFTLFQSFANPDILSVWQLLLVLSMIVVGGSGTIAGTLIGVVAIGVLPEIMRTAMSKLLVWQELVYGLIIVLAMVYMPHGMWGLVKSRLRRRSG